MKRSRCGGMQDVRLSPNRRLLTSLVPDGPAETRETISDQSGPGGTTGLKRRSSCPFPLAFQRIFTLNIFACWCSKIKYKHQYPILRPNQHLLPTPNIKYKDKIFEIFLKSLARIFSFSLNYYMLKNQKYRFVTLQKGLKTG